MKLRCFILILLATLLCACSKSKPEDPRFIPQLNPEPKYFITYQGFIDPSLNNLVQLTILTVYETTNPECEEDTNPLAGVLTPRKRSSYIHIQPNAKGHFYYKVPLDKYLPGFCKWEASWTNYNDQSIKFPHLFESAIWFSNDKSETINLDKEYINSSCTNTECTMLESSNFIVFEHKSIIANKNHILEFNYYRSKKI